MKRALTAVLLGSVVLAAVGCGNARVNVMPRGVGVRHSLRADVAAEIRAARSSNARLFGIFPVRRGSAPCLIPAGGVTSQRGTCRTSVSYPTTHGRYAEAFVDFRERWGQGRHSYSGWTVIVQWPAMKVAATKTQLHGTTAPQTRYAATDSVWAIQARLDAAANYAEKVAGAVHVFAGVRVDDGANKVIVNLVHAPQSVIAQLEKRHPGTYVIHNGAPRTYHEVRVLQDSIDWSAWNAKGVHIVEMGPTQNGYLQVGVTSNVAKAQALFDATYGRGVIRVVHGERAYPTCACRSTG